MPVHRFRVSRKDEEDIRGYPQSDMHMVAVVEGYSNGLVGTG